jgi:hypothetical protein
MKEVTTFDLHVFNTFDSAPLRLTKQSIPVELKLTEGEHTFTSSPIEIGTFFHFKVFGHISITYSYDPHMEYITISGKKDINEKQLAIHVSLEEHPEFTTKQQLNSINSEVSTPNMLTNFIRDTSMVKQYFQTAIYQAIDSLVKHLLDTDIQGVIQTGSAPIVSIHNYQDYAAMFAPKKAIVKLPSLKDIIEIQKTVESTYGGTITWTLNYSFANVIGSTSDPKPPGYNSWIQLWADACNGGHDTTHCSSYNYADGQSGFTCNTDNFVGGHVIPGQSAKKMPKGSTVYIFPICKRHNGKDNIYMSSRYNPEGVVLHNYMK